MRSYEICETADCNRIANICQDCECKRVYAAQADERRRIVEWLRNVSKFDYYGEVFADAIENGDTWENDE